MSEFRHNVTGEVKTQGEWRKHYRNVSTPKVWTLATLTSLNLEAVLRAPKPTPATYQRVVADGIVQDANGNWIDNYAVVEMFADTTDEEGVVTTKAEHEANHQAGLDASAAASVRSQRQPLLVETDFNSLLDRTLTTEMAAYRQALRDVPTQAGFPNNITWPTKP